MSIYETKEYNLFSEICDMLKMFTEDFGTNHNDFVANVHGKWARDKTYPSQVIMTKNNITVVWSDGFRDKYLRKAN